jgi:Zn-dependent protease
MEQLAAQARQLEAHGALRQARELWLACLPLLPAQSKQAEWIRRHALDLELEAHASPAAAAGSHATTSRWVRRLGPLAPLAILAAKFKTFLFAIFKLKFLFSFAAFIGVYWALWGVWFGVGFAVLILVHEMGHFIDIKRRGLPADMPVFLPGLGAYVRWQALGVSLETRAAVSLAGPLAGLLAASICTLLWRETGNGIWAALARTGAWFNVLNLIPVWIFDGGSAAYALSKAERAIILVVSAALGYALGEGVFYFLALGAGWRLFTRDAPPEPSNSTTAYFVAVVTGLAFVMWLLPGHGSGLR